MYIFWLHVIFLLSFQIIHKIINIKINSPNDNGVNLIMGNNINRAAKLPHVPDANFI